MAFSRCFCEDTRVLKLAYVVAVGSHHQLVLSYLREEQREKESTVNEGER